MLSREKIEYITEKYSGTEITSSSEEDPEKTQPTDGFILEINAPGKLGRYGLSEIWFNTIQQARNAARELGLSSQDKHLPIRWQIKDLKNIKQDTKEPTLFEIDEPGKDLWVGDYQPQHTKPFKEDTSTIKNKYPNLFGLDEPFKNGKLNVLVNKINKFAKLCEASILTDMAKRVMVEILPLEKKTDIILKTGIEGRTAIIEYGTAACVQEMLHYNNDLPQHDKENLYEQATQALDSSDYKKTLQLCIKGFSNREKWASNNGGVLWLKIAQSILEIVKLDEKLDSTTNNEEKRKLYGEILTELNHFDGLSHNSASILYNILLLENEKFNHPKENFKEEFNKAMRLRDITELKTDPKTKWHEIKDILKGGGGSGTLSYPDNPYRGTTVSESEQEDVENELTLIKLKKKLRFLELSNHLEKKTEILNILTSPNINPKSDIYKLNLEKLQDLIMAVFVFFTSLKNYYDQQRKPNQSIIDRIEKIRKIIVQNSTLLIDLRNKLLLGINKDTIILIRNNRIKLFEIFNEIQNILLTLI